MAYDGKLSADEIRVFTRVIDDLIGELNDSLEKFAELKTSQAIEYVANQIIFYKNARSAFVLLKARITDMQRS